MAGEYISRVGLIAIDQVIMLYCFFLKYLPSPPPPLKFLTREEVAQFGPAKKKITKTHVAGEGTGAGSGGEGSPSKGGRGENVKCPFASNGCTFTCWSSQMYNLYSHLRKRLDGDLEDTLYVVAFAALIFYLFLIL